MKPHVRGVILEGLSHAGKTSTLKALKLVHANDNNAERSVLVLGEHYSQQLQNIHGENVSLSREEHINLLYDRVNGIEKLNDWAFHLGPANRTSRGLFFVLERFHLNHRFAYGDSREIANIESRLAELGAICFLLVVSPDSIRERILSRESVGGPRANLDQTCNEWLKSQERLVSLTVKSHLQTVLIESDTREWDSYASSIFATMEQQATN